MGCHVIHGEARKAILVKAKYSDLGCIDPEIPAKILN